eukprot:1178040-Pleurochrysis_carterae.AAC.2
MAVLLHIADGGRGGGGGGAHAGGADCADSDCSRGSGSGGSCNRDGGGRSASEPATVAVLTGDVFLRNVPRFTTWHFPGARHRTRQRAPHLCFVAHNLVCARGVYFACPVPGLTLATFRRASGCLPAKRLHAHIPAIPRSSERSAAHYCDPRACSRARTSLHAET